ncbi:MAG: LytR/AlgR family response regulator transcription factor [Crocinitomicaceae bacterium]|jgi:two-component system LytT family response regulator
MRKVLIIDDEKPTRELIKRMLESFNLNISIYTDGENVATGVKAIEQIEPDLVLLDIQMPDGNGFDVLKQTSYKNFQVIFITAFQEFAIQAIKFSALDYILKPIDMEELQSSITRALESITEKIDESQYSALQNNIQPQQKKKLVLKTLESIHIVDIENIIRCEADKNYTSFYLADGKRIIVSKTLKDYDILLSGHNFFRAQQSHLINVNFIDRYDKHDGGSVIMKDGAEVPLSPAKKDQFFRLLENL